MLDVAAIIVSIISLVTSVLVAVITSWVAYSTNHSNYIRDTEELLRKYRDPLLLAAQDLQARLYDILKRDILSFGKRPSAQRDSLFIYTTFLVGQYFAGNYILRRQTQFKVFTTGKPHSHTKRCVNKIDIITDYLNDSRDETEAFVLWKDHQRAIGEVMVTEKGDELLCIDFSEFTNRWKDEERQGAEPKHYTQLLVAQDRDWREANFPLHTWLGAIYKDIKFLVDEPDNNTAAKERLRRFQCYLIDLIELLDPEEQALGCTSSRARVLPRNTMTEDV
ncbi:hypothetical protein V8E54_007003 [Elaphomyces granulatus]|jgi:hypothetical protein